MKFKVIRHTAGKAVAFIGAVQGMSVSDTPYIIYIAILKARNTVIYF